MRGAQSLPTCGSCCYLMFGLLSHTPWLAEGGSENMEVLLAVSFSGGQLFSSKLARVRELQHPRL